jgi:hypothetical protein
MRKQREIQVRPQIEAPNLAKLRYGPAVNGALKNRGESRGRPRIRILSILEFKLWVDLGQKGR